MTAANPFATPPHHTRLPPVLPEARRLAELPEIERVLRYHMLNNWLKSKSGNCPRAWVLRQISSKLSADGDMTDEAYQFIMDDAGRRAGEGRAFYRKTLRYLGFRPPAWTHPGDDWPHSEDYPVELGDISPVADLFIARDDASRVLFTDKGLLANQEGVAEADRQLRKAFTSYYGGELPELFS